jgi:hypothetical protein
MPKRKRIPADPNQRAKAIADFATSDERGMDEARAGTFMRDLRSRLRVGNRISTALLRWTQLGHDAGSP